jgi:hypothetical protein
VLHHAEPCHLGLRTYLRLELGERASPSIEEPIEERATRRVRECLEDAVIVHREQYVTF